MHQDQRIGLALAVLLVGAAGAFFFRNDPKPARQSPRLKTARTLDERISEMQNSPYLQDDEDDRDPSGTSATMISDRGKLRGDDGFQELAPIPLPPGVIESDTVPDAPPLNGRSSRTEPVAERTHIVQKGETLSSIAARELGSSIRFTEIFEANRDRLKDANDVRIGMSLRIPSRDAIRSESAANSSTSRPKLIAPPLLPPDSNGLNDDPAPPIATAPGPHPTDRTNNSDAPKKKFEPAKRSPIAAPGMGKQSSAIDATRPTRKLTQLPPQEAGGKVAR